MKQQPELLGEAAYALKHLLKNCSTELAEQVYNCGILPYLLNLLGCSNFPGKKFFHFLFTFLI